MPSFRAEQLEFCEQAFGAGHYGALVEALRYLAVPEWVVEGARDVLLAAVHGKVTKYKRWRRQHVYDLIDALRAGEVSEAHERQDVRLRWEDAYEFACQALIGTQCAGSSKEMRRSYLRFRKRQRQAPGRYLITQEDAIEIASLGPQRLTEHLLKALAWAGPRRGKGRTITRVGS